jgi:hypothetical protein
MEFSPLKGRVRAVTSKTRSVLAVLPQPTKQIVGIRGLNAVLDAVPLAVLLEYRCELYHSPFGLGARPVIVGLLVDKGRYLQCSAVMSRYLSFSSLSSSFRPAWARRTSRTSPQSATSSARHSRNAA